MARPRKIQNQGLPQNLLCRRRKRANGKITKYFYYVLENGKEKPLGTDKLDAILEAAKLNVEFHKNNEVTLFIDVAKRYELEVVPTKKAKNTRNSNLQASSNLCKFFGSPPAPLDAIEPPHIVQYLQWRKNTPAVANMEVSLFNTIWNKAREWGYTKLISPTIGVKKYPTKYRKIYDGILHITQQKTGKKVRFEIAGKLKEIIERRLVDNADWLFTNKRGRKLARRSLGDHFKEIRDKAIQRHPELKSELEQVQIRDLRAKAATDISLSASDERAQKNLGHTSKRTTQHYIRKDKVLKTTDEII